LLFLPGKIRRFVFLFFADWIDASGLWDKIERASMAFVIKIQKGGRERGDIIGWMEEEKVTKVGGRRIRTLRTKAR